MNNDITDIYEVLSTLKSKISSLERTISEQSMEISRLNRIINQKDKRIHALEKENKKLMERLSGYEKPDKDSHNSSIAPSQESIKAKAIRRTSSLREKSTLKSGGQPGHPGRTLETSPDPDFIEVHMSEYCSHCGKTLNQSEAVLSGSSQVVDIPPVCPQVREHRCYTKTCTCGHINNASLPNECSKRISYGINIQAITGYLAHVQCIPFERICETLRDLFGLRLSEGTVKNILARIGNKANAAYEQIRERIQRSAVVGADETGEFIHGKLHWGWIFQTYNLTYAYQDKSRGMEAIEKHFPDGLPQTILVSDRHSSYFKMDVKGHQVCLAHLLRNVQYLDELDTRQDWSTRFGTLLRDAIRLSKSNPLKGIAIQGVNNIKDRLDRLLEESLTHLDKDFQAFKKGIAKCRDYIFTFLENPNVPHHNNASEGGIRKIKVKQKVSGCFRTEDGADIFMKIHAVVETAKKNGNSKFDAILAVVEL
jgi:transposase/uncharacterized coiled-coil protein SlyX